MVRGHCDTPTHCRACGRLLPPQCYAMVGVPGLYCSSDCLDSGVAEELPPRPRLD